MEEHLQKLYQLIHSGEKENIDLALSISDSNKIELVDYNLLYNWLVVAGLVTGDLLSIRAKIEAILELKTLSWTHQNIGKIPDFIVHLTSVTEAMLFQNKLHKFPEPLSRLTNLTKLCLQYNQLEHLPESIGKLTNLKELWLNQNQLKSLPSSIGNLFNLENLWLENNQLSSIPSSIQHLTQLKKLCLHNNPLQEKEVAQLKMLLPNCKIMTNIKNAEF